MEFSRNSCRQAIPSSKISKWGRIKSIFCLPRIRIDISTLHGKTPNDVIPPPHLWLCTDLWLDRDRRGTCRKSVRRIDTGFRSIANVEEEIERSSRINDTHVSNADTMLLMSRLTDIRSRDPLWITMTTLQEELGVQLRLATFWQVTIISTMITATWMKNLLRYGFDA